MISPDEFRRVLGHFCSGVTVITTMDPQGRPAGLTASAFTSVSLTPPMVLVCVAHDAHSYQALAAAKRFAVNILAGHHEAVSTRFATKPAAHPSEKFEGVDFRQSALGLPVLKDSLAELECETVHAYPAGDHTIFVGRVEAADAHGDADLEPLLYYRGKYRRIHT
ncbi:MAG: flavin reductase family protein [Candidatus Rokubacteria bacterium]|nr:flavin reductase family protein [Candidatus Rokubacteria bacterium]